MLELFALFSRPEKIVGVGWLAPRSIALTVNTSSTLTVNLDLNFPSQSSSSRT